MGIHCPLEQSTADPTQITDLSTRLDQLSFATNEHGFEAARGHAPMRFADAARISNQPGCLHIPITWNGATLWEGRLEAPTLATEGGSGLSMGGMGYQRALSDVPYTALWSTQDCTVWRPYTSLDDGSFSENLYQYSVNNGYVRLFPQRGLTYGTTGTLKAGGLAFDIPSGSSRQIVGIAFTYAARIRTDWLIRLLSYTINPTTFVATVWTYAAGGAGALTRGAFCASITACDRLVLAVNYNAADAVYNFDNGDVFVDIYPRVVTTTANMVATTLTAGTAAGNNISFPVGSTANMYVGQPLYVGAGGGAFIGQQIVVESIPDATHFVGDSPTTAYGAGTTVCAPVVYADEIVRHMATVMSAINPTQISASAALIQSPSRDLFQEVYEDQYPADVLTYLITLGDNQATPRKWEWAVWEQRLIAFRPRGTAANTWYVDIADLAIAQTLEDLSNSVYATYQDTNNATLRTAISADTPSVARFGLTRRQAVPATSANSVQAIATRDAALNDGKNPPPKSQLTLDAIFTLNGVRVPAWMLRAQDTITVRNIPPTVTLRVKTFRVIHTEYDVFARAIAVELEAPRPTVHSLLADVAQQLAAPSKPGGVLTKPTRK